jgi:hypothetical protein
LEEWRRLEEEVEERERLGMNVTAFQARPSIVELAA